MAYGLAKYDNLPSFGPSRAYLRVVSDLASRELPPSSPLPRVWKFTVPFVSRARPVNLQLLLSLDQTYRCCCGRQIFRELMGCCCCLGTAVASKSSEKSMTAAAREVAAWAKSHTRTREEEPRSRAKKSHVRGQPKSRRKLVDGGLKVGLLFKFYQAHMTNYWRDYKITLAI